MKKVRHGKLDFSKETLRKLDEVEAGQVAGGTSIICLTIIVGASDTYSCYSDCDGQGTCAWHDSCWCGKH